VIEAGSHIHFVDGAIDFYVGLVNPAHHIGIVMDAHQPLSRAQIAAGVEVGRMTAWGIGAQ
jgi:hypothetical protein